jgi:hypothetical protein
MTSIPPITDHLYQEGLILGDFVVNEFLKSNRVFTILGGNEDLLVELSAKLKDRLAEYRQQCLSILEECQFIDKTLEPLISLQALVPKSQALTHPPTPSEISKSALEKLAGLPLSQQTFLPRKIIPPCSGKDKEEERLSSPTDPIIKKPKVSPDKSTSASKYLERSGLFSGLIAPMSEDMISSEEGEDELSRPSTPQELKLRPSKMMESDSSAQIYGVLDRTRIGTNNSKRKPSSRRLFNRQKKAAEGFFQKDGSYRAVAHNGFVHLCGGALEWPFKSAEMSFVDFFQTDVSSAALPYGSNAEEHLDS